MKNKEKNYFLELNKEYNNYLRFFLSFFLKFDLDPITLNFLD